MSNQDRREFISTSSALFAGALANANSISSDSSNGGSEQEPQTKAMTNKTDRKFIYFVARTPYNTASGRYVKKLESESVLGWFQENWNSGENSKQILGESFYGLQNLFDSDEACKSVPASLEEVIKDLEKRCYNDRIKTKDDALEFYTDDDEMNLVYHWFTSEFAEQNMDRVGFLIHDGWLPTNVNVDPKSKPTTYLCSRTPSQTCDSELWDFFEIPGIRLDQIGDVVSVMDTNSGSDSYWLKEFLKEVPTDFSWKQAIEKLVEDQCTWKDAKNESRFNCSKHVCEMQQHHTTHENWKSKPKEFQQFIVFDDLWAAAHPTLATAIRRFEKRAILFS